MVCAVRDYCRRNTYHDGSPCLDVRSADLSIRSDVGVKWEACEGFGEHTYKGLLRYSQGPVRIAASSTYTVTTHHTIT